MPKIIDLMNPIFLFDILIGSRIPRTRDKKETTEAGSVW